MALILNEFDFEIIYMIPYNCNLDFLPLKSCYGMRCGVIECIAEVSSG